MNTERGASPDSGLSPLPLPSSPHPRRTRWKLRPRVSDPCVDPSTGVRDEAERELLVTKVQASGRGPQSRARRRESLCRPPVLLGVEPPSWWEEVWKGTLPSAYSLQFTEHFPTCLQSNPRGSLAEFPAHTHLEGQTWMGPRAEGRPICSARRGMQGSCPGIGGKDRADITRDWGLPTQGPGDSPGVGGIRAPTELSLSMEGARILRRNLRCGKALRKNVAPGDAQRSGGGVSGGY